MKTLKIILAFALCIAFSVSFSAHAVPSSEVLYENEEVSVIFEEDSALSVDKKQFIASKLIYGDSYIDNGISSYSLCWLTGHDLVSEVVSVIEHKVRTAAPRCDRKTYEVETCTKCDYMKETLIADVPYICCPVD